jgi:hypothetical protein
MLKSFERTPRRDDRGGGEYEGVARGIFDNRAIAVESGGMIPVSRPETL